jgi:hypothetical protein
MFDQGISAYLVNFKSLSTEDIALYSLYKTCVHTLIQRSNLPHKRCRRSKSDTPQVLARSSHEAYFHSLGNIIHFSKYNHNMTFWDIWDKDEAFYPERNTYDRDLWSVWQRFKCKLSCSRGWLRLLLKSSWIWERWLVLEIQSLLPFN